MKQLIIYFSHTGENYINNKIRNIDKGNTEIVAETIQKITGADLFKIEPVNNYPYSYQECCDLAKEELNNNIKPEIKNQVNNIENYDVIYIGGPIWWGYYPRVMITAIADLNFAGKIVKPFTTHEGSNLGNIMQDVTKYCVGADIRPGLAIRGSEVSQQKEIIESWCIK